MSDISIEHLLKPRYIVQAKYPGMTVDIGDIVEDEYVDVRGIGRLQMSTWPHLFRKLEWFEERAIEEMPKYVKYIASDKISPLTKEMIDYGGVVCEDYIPATEQQFLDYINKKP